MPRFSLTTCLLLLNEATMVLVRTSALATCCEDETVPSSASATANAAMIENRDGFINSSMGVGSIGCPLPKNRWPAGPVSGGNLIAELGFLNPKIGGSHARDVGTGESGPFRGINPDRVGMRQHATIRSWPGKTRRRRRRAGRLPPGRADQRHHRQFE